MHWRYCSLALSPQYIGFIVTWHTLLVIHRSTVKDDTFNSLRPRPNGRHFADDIFKCIFLNEDVSIFIKISLKFIRKGPINTIPAFVKLMAWHWTDDKPLSEPIIVRLPMHICSTWSQRVNKCLVPKSTWYISYDFKQALCIFHDLLLQRPETEIFSCL